MTIVTQFEKLVDVQTPYGIARTGGVITFVAGDVKPGKFQQANGDKKLMDKTFYDKKRKQALINELSKIALDINTKGSLMNDMVTKQGDFVSKSTKDSSRSSVASGKGSSISNERRNDNRTKN